MRRVWGWIGHAFTAKEIILLLGAVSIGGFSYWLATANSLFRLFAPWSYLVASLIGFILGTTLFLVGISAFQRLTGWKPAPRIMRQKKDPPRDAPMADVIQYICTESRLAASLGMLSEAERTLALNNTVSDAVGEKHLHIWARSGLGHMLPISFMEWPAVVVHTDKQALQIVPQHGLAQPYWKEDVFFNWREVRKAWPKLRFWQRRL